MDWTKERFHMEKNKQLTVLAELVQVNIDAVHVYQRALGVISDHVIRSRLEMFLDEHMTHIAELSEEVRALGGKPTEKTKDLKGHIFAAYTALRSATGMKGALEALKTSEEMTHRYYGQVVPKKMPAPLRDIFRKHLSNERNHIEYITNNLQAL
jgi:uncharacterized protein (TIGR02284 family)